MDNVMTSVTARQDSLHPIRRNQNHSPRRDRRLDRLALRVGFTLIAWGRRPQPAATREGRARRFNRVVANDERRRSAERMLRLMVPPR